jgi:hypothetical protein
MHRDQRRRQRSLHPPRGILDDRIMIINVPAAKSFMTIRYSVDACRAKLDGSRKLTKADRLSLEIALGRGRGVTSFSEFRRRALSAVKEAGSIDAAIKKLARARARSPKEITNER